MLSLLRWAHSNLNSHKTAPPKRCRLGVNLFWAMAGASCSFVVVSQRGYQRAGARVRQGITAQGWDHQAADQRISRSNRRSNRRVISAVGDVQLRCD